MPYSDPDRQAEYFRDYRKFRGRPHKRAYTNSGGEWKCAICGATVEDGVQLDVHHKDQDHTNNDPDNLACLCSECHQNLHTRWYKYIVPVMVTKAIRDGRISWKGEVIE